MLRPSPRGAQLSEPASILSREPKSEELQTARELLTPQKIETAPAPPSFIAQLLRQPTELIFHSSGVIRRVYYFALNANLEKGDLARVT